MKYEVVWVTEGVAVVEADSSDAARENFWDARDHFTQWPDSITVDAIVSPIEN